MVYSFLTSGFTEAVLKYSGTMPQWKELLIKQGNQGGVASIMLQQIQ